MCLQTQTHIKETRIYCYGPLPDTFTVKSISSPQFAVTGQSP